MKLNEATAFITGGAMGVGAGVAEALLKQGTRVFLADVNEEQGTQTETSLRSVYGNEKVRFVKCDVTDENSFTAAFNSAVEEAKHIDIMINNAGIIHERIWKKMLAVNIDGIVIGTNLAVEHMRKDKNGKGGIIINTGSYAGLDPRFVFPIYAASKAAVVHYTSCWASNPYLKDMGIRFASINPTAVDTVFQKFKDEQVLYPDDFRNMLKSLSLLPVDEVVKGFMELIVDEDSNGAILTISLKHGVSPVKLEITRS